METRIPASERTTQKLNELLTHGVAHGDARAELLKLAVRVAAYEREAPAVVQCFLDDFEACIAHLRFPLRHRRVIRTTNLLERLFLEERA